MTKRSSTKLTRREQFAPVFFVDRNLGCKQLPDALRADGWIVECHSTHFPQNNNGAEQNDTEWIKYAGSKGWFILTADLGINHNPVERDAMLNSGTLAFMMAKGNRTGLQMAEVFIKAKQAIFKKARKHKPPGIFKVSVNDFGVSLYLPKPE